MKNKIWATLLMMIFSLSSVTAYSQAEPAGAAGGITTGTAVAIGIVGAALLVALGDSSSSAAAGVSAVAVPAVVAGSTPAATTTTGTTATSATTTTATSTTTTSN